MSPEKIELEIGGMDCSSCAVTVKKAMEEAGGEAVWVDFANSYAVCELKNKDKIDDLLKNIKKAGYSAKIKSSVVDFPSDKFSNRLFYLLLLNAPSFLMVMAGMFMQNGLLHSYVFLLFLTLPSFLSGLFTFIPSALGSIRYKSPNMDVLVSLAILASFGTFYASGIVPILDDSELHFFAETGISIVFFMIFGKWIEKMSLDATLKKAGMLKRNDFYFSTYRKVVNPLSGIQTEEVRSVDIRPDDLILVPDGGIIPVDGRVEEGEAEVDESVITGEAMPVLKTKGKTVFGGTGILHGNLIIRADKSITKSFIGELQNWITRARMEKPRLQEVGDRIAAWFVPAVVLTAMLAFVVFMLKGGGITTALLRSVAVLVISCPCAVGLAAPVAIAVGLGRAATFRVLFKKSSAFQELSNCEVFVFDKTGTLTTGNFEVESWENVSESSSDKDILKLVMAAQTYSLHPIAQSMLRWLQGMKVLPDMITDVREEKGKGIYFRKIHEPDTEYFIGKTEKPTEENILHEIILKKGDKMLAYFYMKDQIRPDAAGLIAYLRSKGKIILLLSGDKKERCLHIGKELGIPEENIYFEKRPDEKLAMVQDLSSKYRTCMVGDGVNDAPALAAAHVSVSIHKALKITADAADIVDYDMHNPLRAIKIALSLSEKLVRIIYQNYFWALLYNAVAIPLAVAGYVSPLWAALSMAFSDLVVVGNSMRMRISGIKNTSF
jgi:Cu+-exporting ATPase